MQPTDNKRNITILFFTMIVVMLGFGMIIPILPFYIEQFGASGKGLGALMATFSIMQFIFSPIWGALSDRYGRKPILMIGVLGNVLAQVLMGLSTQLWMLFVARALAGILSSATLPTAMAYISDSTSHDQRSGGMGIIGAAQGIGMVLGPGIGGWLAAQSLQLPFFVAAGFSAIDRWALKDAPDQELFNGAMHGMVSVLHRLGDEHSEFVDAGQQAAFNEDYDQEFGGVGIRLRMLGEPPLPTVIGLPEPGSPAEGADLRPGDVIVRYDGVRVEDDEHLINIVKLTEIGRKVPVMLIRDRERMVVNVEVTDKPKVQTTSQVSP